MYSTAFYSRDAAYAENLSREIQQHLRPLVPSGRVLDVGCGAGEFLQLARAQGYDVHGLDTSEAAIELCRNEGLTATRADLTEFRPGDDSFDVVTLWDVIEHLTAPRDYLAAAHRLLRPGGLLVVKTPDMQWSVMTLARALSSLGRARGVLGYPPHVLYFDARSLERLLRSSGFRPEDMRRTGSIRTARPRNLRSRVYRGVLKRMEQLGIAGNLLWYARKQ